jgi:hypothetical protein
VIVCAATGCSLTPLCPSCSLRSPTHPFIRSAVIDSLSADSDFEPEVRPLLSIVGHFAASVQEAQKARALAHAKSGSAGAAEAAALTASSEGGASATATATATGGASTNLILWEEADVLAVLGQAVRSWKGADHDAAAATAANLATQRFSYTEDKEVRRRGAWKGGTETPVALWWGRDARGHRLTFSLTPLLPSPSIPRAQPEVFFVPYVWSLAYHYLRADILWGAATSDHTKSPPPPPYRLFPVETAALYIDSPAAAAAGAAAASASASAPAAGGSPAAAAPEAHHAALAHAGAGHGLDFGSSSAAHSSSVSAPRDSAK